MIFYHMHHYHYAATGDMVKIHSIIIGASLSKPHINGTSLLALYINIYVYGR
jgi:hypothetical protein